MKTLEQIEAAIRQLQRDNANANNDEGLYPEVEAVNQALLIISYVQSAEILIDKLLEKRQNAQRKALNTEEDKEYQKELANWYGIILDKCGYQLPE